MIAVRRRAKPAKLTTDAAAWTQALCQARADYYVALDAYLADPTHPKPKTESAVGSHYGHTQVKDQLKTMFRGKCCYCEAFASANSPLHVEHFFPASVYPALAYEWNNLLYACFICNSVYKSDHFPIGATEQDAREDRANLTRQPRASIRLLLDPCRDDPEQHFTFDNGRLVALTRRGELTREVCGLNRDDLITLRTTYMTLLQPTIRFFQALPDDATRAALKKCCTAKSPFAAMARAELAQHHIDWQTL